MLTKLVSVKCLLQLYFFAFEINFILLKSPNATDVFFNSKRCIEDLIKIINQYFIFVDLFKL